MKFREYNEVFDKPFEYTGSGDNFEFKVPDPGSKFDDIYEVLFGDKTLQTGSVTLKGSEIIFNKN